MGGRIISIEAFEIELPLPRPLKLGAIVTTHRQYVIVRVRDDEGSVGTSVGLTRNAPIADTVMRTVAPILSNSDLDKYARTYSRLVQANVCLGTNGVFWRALSVADCAVHDLMSRRAGLPLCDFLGGRQTPVPCLMVGGYPSSDETLDSLSDEMKKMAKLSFAGVKIGSSGNFGQDTCRLAACRDASPDGPPLMIDLYWQCDRGEDLLRHALDWIPFRMGWIEDPVGFDDFRSAALLASNLPYPVAIGDEQCGLLHFERLMDEGGVRVVRLDATVCGGVTGFRAIAKAAVDRGLRVACHLFSELHTHLAAATEGVECVEMFFPEAGLDSLNLVTNSEMRVVDGHLIASGVPGIGYDWNEDALTITETELTMVTIDLQGKYILTTGGLGSIAEFVTHRLLEAGAILLITDILPQEEAEAKLRSWNLSSNTWRYFPMDVTDEASVSSSTRSILDRFPATDCVISLSGGCALHPFSKTDVREYDRIFDYNYHGHVRIARTITDIWTLLQTKGHMIFTSSLVGSLPWVDLAAYAPAKAALEMLAKCLALEFADQGIRFNCIAPGHVATGSSLKVYEQDDEYRRLVDSAIPLRRLVRPESIADAYLWLSSPLAQDVNGQVIKIDCGASIPKVG